MAKVARIGDSWSGVCVCCDGSPAVTGSVETGSGTTFADGQGVARIGDIVRGSCGHMGTINSGSSIMRADGIGVSRLGDTTIGCLIGSITSGSPTTNTD